MLNPFSPASRATVLPRGTARLPGLTMTPLVLLAVVALVVSACSSGTATTAAGPATSAGTPATTAVPATGAADADGPTQSPGSASASRVMAAKGEIPERFKGYRSDTYAKDDLWLCKPGIAVNHCTDEDLDSTVVRADGSTELVKRTIAKDAPVDCFYVYPTVNLEPGGGNKLDLSQSGVEQLVLKTQGARFTETCNVYAPLYRQMNLSAYSAPEAERKKADDLAYSDVLDAFKHYMANDNKGKPFVLLGHSQGSGHLAHLLKDEFDDDPALQGRLVSALLIGGFVQVPRGQDVGGTFQHLSLCRTTTQTGCIVAYNSFGSSSPAGGAGFGASTPEGLTGACVNPASPGGGAAALDPFVPDFTKAKGLPAVSTPFVQLPGTMSAECRDDGTRTYLAISATPKPGDPRDVTALVQNQPGWGLHITEFNLTMGNLLALVRSEIATIK